MLDRSSGATIDVFREDGYYWHCGSSHVRDIMCAIKSLAEKAGVCLAPHVEPTDDERKEVCPHSRDGITCIPRKIDEIFEIHQ